MAAAFLDRALDDIASLHRRLQAWLRAEGTQDGLAILHHFDPSFTRVTPSGDIVTYDMLHAGLHPMWGSRLGLVIEVSHQTVRHSGPGYAVLTYQERQFVEDTMTDRISTVLMLDVDGRPRWRHLQETMITPAAKTRPARSAAATRRSSL